MIHSVTNSGMVSIIIVQLYTSHTRMCGCCLTILYLSIRLLVVRYICYMYIHVHVVVAGIRTKCTIFAFSWLHFAL